LVLLLLVSKDSMDRYISIGLATIFFGILRVASWVAFKVLEDKHDRQ
jgi:hypothetical protein